MSFFDRVGQFTEGVKARVNEIPQRAREYWARLGGQAVVAALPIAETPVEEVPVEATIHHPIPVLDEKPLESYTSFFRKDNNPSEVGSDIIYYVLNYGFLGKFQAVSDFVRNFDWDDHAKGSEREIDLLNALGYKVSRVRKPLANEPGSFRRGLYYEKKQSDEAYAAYVMFLNLSLLARAHIVSGGVPDRNDSVNTFMLGMLARTTSVIDPEKARSVKRFGRILTKVLNCIYSFSPPGGAPEFELNHLMAFPNYLDWGNEPGLSIAKDLRTSFVREAHREKIIQLIAASRSDDELLESIGYPIQNTEKDGVKSASEGRVYLEVKREAEVAALVLRAVATSFKDGVPGESDNESFSIIDRAVKKRLQDGGITLTRANIRGDKGDLVGRIVSKLIYSLKRLEVPVSEEA